MVAGEEVTTRHGHWLAVGLPPRGWVDWRYGPRDGVFERYADEVRAGGGLVVAAHPAVALQLNASHDDGATTAGLGETLRVPPGGDVTVTAAVTGAPEASLAVVTEAGCVGRAKTDDSGAGMVRWTGSGADARFARVEVRRAARGRFPSMVALSNPVWFSVVS